MSLILQVQSVSKCYRLRSSGRTLREVFRHGLRNRHAVKWALRDVTFTVKQGQALGIVGHNGAGKSTLLRLLCGLGRPTSGRIHCAGAIGALLELGAGFHPDLTGRDNLMTVGLLNGLSRRAIRAREEEVIAFAELEGTIDEPVRTYSAGMYLRLAFAAAMAFDPAILVIDEVLAVGDARFQQKCLERLWNLRTSGRTLLLTSHSEDQIRASCDEVLVLEEGQVVMQGEPAAALACYHELLRRRTAKRSAELGATDASPLRLMGQGWRDGTQEAGIEKVRLFGEHGEPVERIGTGAMMTVELDYRRGPTVSDVALTLGIYSDTHVKCFEATLASLSSSFGPLPPDGTLQCRFAALPLLPGTYYVNVGLYPTDWAYVYDYHWQMHAFQILPAPHHPDLVRGVVALDPVWSQHGLPE